MQWGKTIGCVVLVAVAWLSTGCSTMGIPKGPPSGEQAVRITRNVAVKRPPAASLTAEAPPGTYAEMLGKGYARLGQITIRDYTAYGTEGDAKKKLLAEAQQSGAEVAWITVTKDYASETQIGENIVPTGSYSYSRVAVFGENKFYRYSGTAVLFARDPELAAKQLRQGRGLWKTKVAAIHAKRSVLLDKISRIQTVLHGFDVAMFRSPEDAKLLDSAASKIKTMIQTGKTVESKPVSGYYDVFPTLGYISPDRTTGPYKDISSRRAIEVKKLVDDAMAYSDMNEKELYDYQTENLRDQILFE